MKKEFAKNLIKKIEKEKIKQTPKYLFTLKNILVWLFLSISIFLGALSISISLEYLYSADWYLGHRIGYIKIFFSYLPVFWLIFLIISIIFSILNLKHTKKGYKFSILKILGINIILSVIIGTILFFGGINNNIEGLIEKYIPNYRGLLVDDKLERMAEIWQDENEGLLLGTIVEINENFSFQDYNNKIWNLIIDENTVIKGRLNLIEGLQIKIVGEKLSDNEFSVTEIRPFSGKGNQK